MLTVTPLMRQYLAIKEEFPHALLLFQVGDFYELFYDDAKKAAEVLAITLTSRGKNNGEPIPLCGVPMHAINHYLPKLVKAGYHVALCNQLEEAKPGTLVKRAVTQVLTPATLTDALLLDARTPSYLLSCAFERTGAALVFAEILTAQLFVTLIETDQHKALEAELARFMPDEIVMPQHRADGLHITDTIKKAGFSATSVAVTADEKNNGTTWVNKQFDHETVSRISAHGALQESFHVLHTYLAKNQKQALDTLRAVRWYSANDYMMIDSTTQRNLEIVRPMREGSNSPTLVSLLDRSSTAMGSRMIRKWIVRPLLQSAAIEKRHEVVAFFAHAPHRMDLLIRYLKEIGDLERVVGRFGLERATIYDFFALRDALAQLPLLADFLQESVSLSLVRDVHEACHGFSDLYDLLKSALVDEYNSIGVIKKGFDYHFDEVCLLAYEGHKAIEVLEAQEQKATGIGSLKIRYNSVHGYAIEITKTHMHLVPDRYSRHQTLVGKERFMTPELKRLEFAIAQANGQREQLEKSLIEKIRQEIRLYVGRLRRTANAIAHLDALASFASVAYVNRYVRPVFNNGDTLIIEKGRHPVVEVPLKNRFIANDTRMSKKDSFISLITGPNMGGKSTYLRQVALIQIMAQAGSFVPAASVSLPLIDRVFTRIGAGDDVAGGKSTFLVEMEETAAICAQATERSLIILDEVGRGTSTYDGIAIAQSIVEYMYTQIKAYCFFATHYQELTHLEQQYAGIRNYHAANKKTETGILLLYSIVPGIANGSFGIDAARFAQMPASVIERSYEIVRQLGHQAKPDTSQKGQKEVEPCICTQCSVLLRFVNELDFDTLSPRALYEQMYAWQQRLKRS